MAFLTEDSKDAPRGKSNIPDNKKAVGFLNFFLPNKGTNSGRTKLGAIPLRELNGREVQLAQWLTEDPTQTAARLEVILGKLEIEYNSATPDEAAAFDLE